MDYVRRGNLEFSLESPHGTKSLLLSRRPFDRSSDFSGFQKWPMSSVQFWGEELVSGTSNDWKLLIKFQSSDRITTFNWSLIFHGTQTKPSI